jgi:uncharacterized protein YjbJ (UPF0337 family)
MARQRWSRLTRDSAGLVAGRRQQTQGEIQEAYGVSKATSQKQLSDWQARQHKVDPIYK